MCLVPGTEPIPGLTSGERLGPYEVRDAIGAGGMGEVYVAHDSRLGRDVAIKILPRSSGGADALARFEREARAVAALSHPNILAIHDVGAEGAVHFVVTELLEGETLRARLAARGALAPGEAVGYGVQIARGLAAAHHRGIVHRDLKPDNIFITRDGRIKILDFGIAIFDQSSAPTGEHAALTRTGLAMGTVGYMSPEQVLGQPATAQSDLFEVGVVMHEMLTGSHPFARRSAPEVQTAVLREDPAPLSRAVPGLSPSLITLIERCLD
jgi:serine/threonine protein kinase